MGPELCVCMHVWNFPDSEWELSSCIWQSTAFLSAGHHNDITTVLPKKFHSLVYRIKDVLVGIPKRVLLGMTVAVFW